MTLNAPSVRRVARLAPRLLPKGRAAWRTSLLWILRWSGCIRLWQYIHRYHVTILTIHGVQDTAASPAWIPLRPQLAPDRLQDWVSVLSRQYRFVSLDDAFEMLTRRKPILPYSLVVTFDDGYRNVLTRALPVLRRYGVPATVFLATGHVERRQPFWFDRLDYALQHAPVNGREIRIGTESVQIHARDRSSLSAAYGEVRFLAKKGQRSDHEMRHEMEMLAARMEADSGKRLADIMTSDEWSAVMTWDEVRDGLARGLSFGSHTVDHVRLGMADGRTVRDQLAESQAIIERHTGRSCRTLSYPNGSFTSEVIRIARDCGYVCAVTSLEGTNRVGDDPMSLRRISPPENVTGTDLIARVCGLSSALSNVRARVQQALWR